MTPLCAPNFQFHPGALRLPPGSATLLFLNCPAFLHSCCAQHMPGMHYEVLSAALRRWAVCFQGTNDLRASSQGHTANPKITVWGACCSFQNPRYTQWPPAHLWAWVGPKVPEGSVLSPHQ